MNQLSNRETDELGESIIRKYCKRFPSNSLCVNIEGFARDFLGMNIVYGSFAGPDEGTLGFLSNGKTSVWLREEDLADETVFPENTVVIDRSLLAPAESGRKRFTIAHEAAHYLLAHRCDYALDLPALMAERERMSKELSAIDGITVYPSDTHILLCRIEGITAAQLKDFLANNHGILIRDASNFKGLDEHHFRIAVQTQEENDHLLKVLRHTLC